MYSGDNLLMLDPHANHLRLGEQAQGEPALFGNLVDTESDCYIDINKEAAGQLQPFLSFTELPRSAYPGAWFSLPRHNLQVGTSNSCLQTGQQGSVRYAKMPSAQTSLPMMVYRSSCRLRLSHCCSPDVSRKSQYMRNSQLNLRPACYSAVRQALRHSDITTSAPTGHLLQKTVKVIRGDDPPVYKSWLVAIDHTSTTGNGVAALLGQSSAQPNGDDAFEPVVTDGRVYITMPLPFGVAGLPVHINGSFWVQSDRRKLWSGEGDRGRVNLFFSQHVHAYTCLPHGMI